MQTTQQCFSCSGLSNYMHEFRKKLHVHVCIKEQASGFWKDRSVPQRLPPEGG